MSKTIQKDKSSKTAKVAVVSTEITKPEPMTIVVHSGKLQFYTGRIAVIDQLVAGHVYELDCNNEIFIDLVLSSPLTLPDKIYDFEQDFREQVLTTLRTPNSNMNVGVLLEGYKGQGKSVVAKQLAIESGLPVILINRSIPKSYDFLGFLKNNIKQDYVLLIDEFEKLFPESDDPKCEVHTQNSFLSFLDGTSSLKHKRLVILTSNKEIGDKFINRPGRIRYYKKYNFMNKEVFRAILADKLKKKKYAADLEDNLDPNSSTIDLLTTIIDEINIHDKPYSSFKSFFNHKEKQISYMKYKRAEDGSWTFIEEIKLKRELTIDDQNVEYTLGWGTKLHHNDGEVLVYEITEYKPNPSDPEGEDVPVRAFYKLTKMSATSTVKSTAFTL